MPEPTQPGGQSAAAGGTLRIQLVRSLIGNTERQRRTVRALGLRRIRQIVTQTDSPATRGLVARVPHLVRILEEEAQATARPEARRRLDPRADPHRSGPRQRQGQDGRQGLQGPERPRRWRCAPLL